MSLLIDSFWRAAAYCLHPRVIALSFLPLVIMVALSLGLGYLYWDAALVWVRGLIDSWSIISSLWGWLEQVGAGGLKTVLAPLIVIFAVTPVIVVGPVAVNVNAPTVDGPPLVSVTVFISVSTGAMSLLLMVQVEL